MPKCRCLQGFLVHLAQREPRLLLPVVFNSTSLNLYVTARRPFQRSHLAQREPGLVLPVEGGKPGQQHPHEQQQQVQLDEAGHRARYEQQRVHRAVADGGEGRDQHQRPHVAHAAFDLRVHRLPGQETHMMSVTRCESRQDRRLCVELGSGERDPALKHGACKRQRRAARASSKSSMAGA